MTNSPPGSDLVALLPEATAADRAALRAAARLPVDLERWAALLAALPPPTYEQLRRRPTSRGEPFRLE